MTALRICPIDWQESGFRAAPNVTAVVRREATSDGSLVLTPDMAAVTQHFTFCPQCSHAEAFARTLSLGILTQNGRAEIEAKWNAETERLFTEYTSGPQWSDQQRANHRARLWPERKTIEDWALVPDPEPDPTPSETNLAADDQRIDWPALITP